MAGISKDAYRNILRSGAHSDFRITSNDVEFKVHKVIITAASEFFRIVCQEGFKVPDPSTVVCLSLTTIRNIKIVVWISPKMPLRL